MTATPNSQPASVANGGATTKAKERQKPIRRFPLQFHFAVSTAMNNSLLRMTGAGALLAAADVGRLALHAYCAANDPEYLRELQQQGN
jgi:hypothetical protein